MYNCVKKLLKVASATKVMTDVDVRYHLVRQNLVLTAVLVQLLVHHMNVLAVLDIAELSVNFLLAVVIPV